MGHGNWFMVFMVDKILNPEKRNPNSLVEIGQRHADSPHRGLPAVQGSPQEVQPQQGLKAKSS